MEKINLKYSIYLKKIIILFCFIFISTTLYSASNNEVILEIRKKIQNLKDSPIGAIDSEGKYTTDSNNGLNCSGFIKWIADGFYMPIRKQNNELPLYMSLQALRTKHPNSRGDRYTNLFEDIRDPYFGLDWTRNIAISLANLRDKKKYGIEDFDIRDSEIVSYIEDRGYPIEAIEEVIKEQERKNPNRIYLCSISGPYGENPRLHQHYHVCVFIPYYADENQLQVAVFERNKETSFDYLKLRNPKPYCHIVWISTEGDFELMMP